MEAIFLQDLCGKKEEVFPHHFSAKQLWQQHVCVPVSVCENVRKCTQSGQWAQISFKYGKANITHLIGSVLLPSNGRVAICLLSTFPRVKPKK